MAWRRWLPWGGRQVRQLDFDDAVARALLDAAGGKSKAQAGRLAAVEFAAGLYEGCFRVARWRPAGGDPAQDPQGSARLPSSSLLGMAARELIRKGEFIAAISVRGGEVSLTPASEVTITGSDDPGTWAYDLTLSGPTAHRRVTLPAASVLHFRRAVSPSAPWQGRGALALASESAALVAETERALAEEASGPRGRLIPLPVADAGGDSTAKLRTDLGDMRGRAALVESVASMADSRAYAPSTDWKPQRLGPDHPAAVEATRKTATEEVLAACGVPVGLLRQGIATGLRESIRLFLTTGLLPMGEILTAEVREKLDVPRVELDFTRLQAADVQGRSRALQSLVGATVPLGEAKRLTGFGS